MRKLRTFTAIAAAAVAAPAMAYPTFELSLGPADLSTPGIASFVLTGTFVPGDADELLIGFDLDLTASSANLTGNGFDYSAFTFTPGAALNVPIDWDEDTSFGLGPIDGGAVLGATSYFALSESAGLGLGAGVLGVISVDYAAAGLVPGDVGIVGIDGEFLGTPFTVGYYIDLSPDDQFESDELIFPSFVDPTFNPGSQQFTVPTQDPGQPGGDVVPEPATVGLGMIALATLVASRRRR